MDAALDTREASAVSRRAQDMGRKMATPMPVPMYQLSTRLPPHVDLTHAMAFDGELYSKAAFAAYYGDADFPRLWDASQKRTHEAACFVHVWFNWSQHERGEDLMRHVARCVRGQEWLEHDWWRVLLVQFVFRALSLRDELLDVYELQRNGNYDNEWGRKELNKIATRWTAKYIVHGPTTPDRTRRVLRVFWQHWFGHKDFAMIVATRGVLFWRETLGAMSHLLQPMPE